MDLSGDGAYEAVQEEMLQPQLLADPCRVEGMTKGLRAESGAKVVGGYATEEEKKTVAEEEKKYEPKNCKTKAEVLAAVAEKNEKQHYDENIKAMEAEMLDLDGELVKKAKARLVEITRGSGGKASMWEWE